MHLGKDYLHLNYLPDCQRDATNQTNPIDSVDGNIKQIRLVWGRYFAASWAYCHGSIYFIYGRQAITSHVKLTCDEDEIQISMG